jgi:hypothetical protein
MGTWGDSIFADDDAQDIYHHYRQLYNQGQTHDEVLRQMEQDWAETLADSDDGPIFWFAVARAQWEFGELTPDVLRRVEEIAEQGLGLDRWREGGPRMLAKCEKAVREFRDKLRTSNPKPKKQKIAKRYPPIYQPGDCLALELCDGSWGAALVLATDDRHATEGRDYVAALEWHASEEPPLDFFHQRLWLGSSSPQFVRPSTIMCFARFHSKMKQRIRRLGQVPLKQGDPKYNGTGRAGGWDNLISEVERYYGLND